MPKYTHKVTADELMAAVYSWHHIMNRPLHTRPFSNPYSFLGRFGDSDNHRTVPVTEATYNKVRMLNSPHARALLKAFKVRTGYHKEIP